ncbi:helicase RepA family protein [Ruminococcaceae bacterium OttesenSCG-928-D13]|nr:helicase RepA family protein [Ruminococcaceae bacterium OttesenSCG-928-D13]
MAKEHTQLHTVDGETLMNRPYSPASYVVDTLIGQGLHILAGAPKVGKSWLALWLCLQVSLGETVWGFDTKQGTVLYLCLEDSEARIQNRLLDITDYAPPCLHFATTAGVLGKGLEEQILHFISSHPGMVLIVIDTLQLVRNVSYDNTYARDYQDLKTLKQIADEKGVAILLIHHLRKEGDNDIFNRVSGTTAIQGVADSTFTLVETQRGSGWAKLSCIGRDIEYREIDLQKNKENVWELVRDSLEMPDALRDDIVPMVVKLLRQHGACYRNTPNELAKALNALCPPGADVLTSRMVYKRLLQNEIRLSTLGISVRKRRSNGNRLVELMCQSADSDMETGRSHAPQGNVPVDPAYLMQSGLGG